MNAQLSQNKKFFKTEKKSPWQKKRQWCSPNTPSSLLTSHPLSARQMHGTRSSGASEDIPSPALVTEGPPCWLGAATEVQRLPLGERGASKSLCEQDTNLDCAKPLRFVSLPLLQHTPACPDSSTKDRPFSCLACNVTAI